MNPVSRIPWNGVFSTGMQDNPTVFDQPLRAECTLESVFTKIGAEDDEMGSGKKSGCM